VKKKKSASTKLNGRGEKEEECIDKAKHIIVARMGVFSVGIDGNGARWAPAYVNNIFEAEAKDITREAAGLSP
jgi:hypothetical protein